MLCYVISNDVFQLDSYSHVSVIYNILSHNIPSCVWHIKTYAHMFYKFLFFQAEAKEGRLSYVFPCNSLIVIRSFTILWRPVQLCFMRVVLGSGDSCNLIIASLNRLVHWKVRFQSLVWLLFVSCCQMKYVKINQNRNLVFVPDYF